MEAADPEALNLFDPRLHHDLVGGVMPGDRVTVIQPGWKIANQIVERAAVKPI